MYKQIKKSIKPIKKLVESNIIEANMIDVVGGIEIFDKDEQSRIDQYGLYNDTNST